ncbi:Hypothetical protein CINCED_3A020074 [Cinara cedri]|uniref:Uncharacterized protein n=1 Tax=Cinara cedri TaxID=506608 RepID=A0A5E4MSC0_9HEMI|nr:Hypothetical protein CINCED_3A020074 [Cinara cedri]
MEMWIRRRLLRISRTESKRHSPNSRGDKSTDTDRRIMKRKTHETLNKTRPLRDRRNGRKTQRTRKKSDAVEDIRRRDNRNGRTRRVFAYENSGVKERIAEIYLSFTMTRPGL